nr:ataxin-7-like protein 3 isoform X2 [Crassostrea gigas]|eukprot:XP_011424902.1 PREDICTED: ataxin-7-like protein 3 isoform X2 [Crassostrea gigas]
MEVYVGDPICIYETGHLLTRSAHQFGVLVRIRCTHNFEKHFLCLQLMDSLPFSHLNGDLDHETLVSDVMYELIDDVTLGLCFEVHRACKNGTLFLGDTDPKSQREHELVDRAGVDVFGHVPTKKQFECVCPNCQRNLAASRFAPHLEKCMGMGRNSSRIANRRQAAMAKENESSRMSVLGDDSADDDNDLDWSYHVDRKIKKLKKDKSTHSPRRNKFNRFHKNGDSSSDRSATPEPGLSYEHLSQEERKQILVNTCGVISEHTKKMCAKSQKCHQHTDDQRVKVRQYLLGQSMVVDEDTTIDIDSLDDVDSSQSLRDNLWEGGSNASSPADSTSTNNSTGSKKRNGPKSAKLKKKKSRYGSDPRSSPFDFD